MPIYKYQDTVGPIVQTVRDAALLLQAMAGKLRHEGKDNANLLAGIEAECWEQVKTR